MNAIKATRRQALAVLSALVGVAGVGVIPAAWADDYASKPITLIVPYPAGGANDAVARLVGQKLAERLKQQVIIDNRPGAGTTIGTAAVVKMPADGYALVLGSLASHAVSPHLYAKPGYDPIADFAPIGMIGVAPIVLTVAKDSPWTDVKSIVDAAKKQPGTLTYGSSGNGSPLHLAGEMFKQVAAIQVNHIPYKGGNAHTMDLIGGRIDMIFDTTTSAVPMIKGGKIRALAVAAPQRLADYPDVPTFAEAGYPGFEAYGWYALYAPAKTPPAIVAKLGTELQNVLKQPEVVDALSKLAVKPTASTPQELARFTKAELDRYGKLIRAHDIRND